MMLNVLLALAIAAAGTACLFGAWRGTIGRRYFPVPVGWTLLCLSGPLWVLGAGAEFGVALLLLATSAVAWLFVLGNRQRRQRRVPRPAGTPKPITEPRSWWRHALLFVLAVPLAAVSSTLLAVALSLALPWSEVDAMVLVLALMPVLWGCAAYWSVADSRTGRPAAVMALVTMISAAVIYI